MDSQPIDTRDDPPPCVLLVDDETSILSALRRVLRTQGYRIVVADSGAAGLALLAQEPVDLVVSDMRMPGMDGAAFLEQVRDRWPQVQRILLTGYADITSTIAAINRGEIHRYIAKPWDDQDLLLSVREGLARRRLEADNQRLLALTQAQNAELARANDVLESRVQARTAEIEQVNAMLEAAYAQLETNFLHAMDVFAGLLELREGGAAGYSRSVALLGKRMAQRLQLSPRDVQDVYVAGLLHAVGKIGLPDGMLHKPFSALSADEKLRYRRHPLTAEQVLMPLPELQRVARLVRMQHERLDGLGFPDGLAGDEWPLAAQVLAVAVEYQSLVSGRQSTAKPTRAAAMAALHGATGTHFSARVIDAFDAVVTQDPDPEQDLCIAAQDLKAGMVLARDLLSDKGTLLLAAGFRFDARVVSQVHDYVRREGAKLRLYVERSAAPHPAPVAVAAT